MEVGFPAWECVAVNIFRGFVAHFAKLRQPAPAGRSLSGPSDSCAVVAGRDGARRGSGDRLG